MTEVYPEPPATVIVNPGGGSVSVAPTSPAGVIVANPDTPDVQVTTAAPTTVQPAPGTATTVEVYGGVPGPPGADGPAGPPGSSGASAYEIALANGFVGSEADWLASLEGPPGTSVTEIYDSTVAPVGATFPYLRFARDVDGHVQSIYLGTVN